MAGAYASGGRKERVTWMLSPILPLSFPGGLPPSATAQAGLGSRVKPRGMNN